MGQCLPPAAGPRSSSTKSRWHAGPSCHICEYYSSHLCQHVNRGLIVTFDPSTTAVGTGYTCTCARTTALKPSNAVLANELVYMYTFHILRVFIDASLCNVLLYACIVIAVTCCPCRASCSQALNHSGVITSVQQEEPDVPLQKWAGKDYYNPFVKDFIELTQPHQGLSSA